MAVLVVTAVLAFVGGPLTGSPAAGQVSSVEPIQLSITAQSAVVPADGTFVLELAVSRLRPITAEPGEYRLNATIFDRLREESGVDLQPAVPLARYDPVAVTDMERNRNNRFRMELPVLPDEDSADASDSGDAVVLTEAGVYPVTIDMSGPDGVVASARTNLIRLPVDGDDGTAAPILGPVAVVLEVSSVAGDGGGNGTGPSGRQAGDQSAVTGPEDPGSESELTVDQAVEVLAELPDLPMAVLLKADMLNELAANRQQAAALAAAMGDRPLFVSPAVDLDPSALAEVGQGHIFQQAMQQSWAQARSIGLQPDTTVTVLSRQLTAQGVEALAAAGITTAIDTSESSSTNDIARSGEAKVNLIRFEDDVSSGFRVGDTASLTANRALARLVLRYQTDRSPAVLRGDSPGVDQTNGLGVLLRWVDLLAKQGRARTAAATDIRPASVRRLAERPNQNLEVHQQLLDDVDRLLASFSAMYDLREDSSPVEPAADQWAGQPAGQTTPNDYRRELRSALTLDQTPQERHRSLLLFSEDLAGEIEVLALPVAQPVTMAASVGEVPVIIESRAAGPRRVMLQFRSDKVIVEQDQQLVVLDPGISSIDVRVQARTLGSSQLQISIWTPDGEQMLASNQFQIRSTAVPGLGVLISVVAVALLLLWWYLDHRRSRRRATAEHPAVVIDDTGDDLEVVVEVDAVDQPHPLPSVVEPAETVVATAQPDRRSGPVVAISSGPTPHSVTVVMPDTEAETTPQTGNNRSTDGA